MAADLFGRPSSPRPSSPSAPSREQYQRDMWQSKISWSDPGLRDQSPARRRSIIETASIEPAAPNLAPSPSGRSGSPRGQRGGDPSSGNGFSLRAASSGGNSSPRGFVFASIEKAAEEYPRSRLSPRQLSPRRCSAFDGCSTAPAEWPPQPLSPRPLSPRSARSTLPGKPPADHMTSNETPCWAPMAKGSPQQSPNSRNSNCCNGVTAAIDAPERPEMLFEKSPGAAGRCTARESVSSRGLWRDLPVYSTCGRFLESTGLAQDVARSSSPGRVPRNTKEVADKALCPDGGASPMLSPRLSPRSRKMCQEVTGKVTNGRQMPWESSGSGFTSARVSECPSDADGSGLAAGRDGAKTPVLRKEGIPRSQTLARSRYVEQFGQELPIKPSSQGQFRKDFRGPCGGPSFSDFSRESPPEVAPPKARNSKTQATTSTEQKAAMEIDCDIGTSTVQSASVQVPAWATTALVATINTGMQAQAAGGRVDGSPRAQARVKGCPERRQTPLYALTLSRANCSPGQRRDFDSQFRPPERHNSVHPIVGPRKAPIGPMISPSASPVASPSGRAGSCPGTRRSRANMRGPRSGRALP